MQRCKKLVYAASEDASANFPNYVSVSCVGYQKSLPAVQDAYMPKDVSKAGHRGIGFVTFQGSDALERVMATTHSMHGTELAVDRAEPKAAVSTCCIIKSAIHA